MNNREQLIADFSGHEVETAESLLRCVKGPVTTDSFRRLLLLFLRGHYGSRENFMGFDWLGCYTWDDSDNPTLVVDFTHDEDDRKPDNVPGVYVGFSETTDSRIALGDFAGHTDDRAGTHLARESTANFDVYHVSKNASDAYDLAELSKLALTAMGEPLAKNAGAQSFQVGGIRRPKVKKGSPEKYYTVATPVEIKYTLAVTRSLESHRIRTIIQKIDYET